MSYQTTYPGGSDLVIDAEFTEIPVKQKPWPQSWFATSKASPERAMQQIQIDRCHAFITAAALQNMAVLSAIESRAVEEYPQNAHLCHDIVSGYAEAAARMVRRWR